MTAVGDRTSEGFFLTVPEKLDDPYADFRYLREQHPVFFYEPLSQWFVFSFDDVDALFHDERLSADRMKGFVDAAPDECRPELRRLAPFFESWVLMTDGPAHGRLRSFLHAGFNPAAVRRLRGAIQDSADLLLDAAAGTGRIDVCGDYAFLLPAYVLSDFLGVPAVDRSRVVQWSVDFVDFFNVVPITIDTTRRMTTSALAMLDYTQRLLDQRRASPRDDFLGALVTADRGGDGLTDHEIVGNTMLLLLAGHVAVRNLIGNAVWLLMTHPDQRAALQGDPSLLDGAVEEAVRFETPVTMIPRITLEDVEVRGQVIPAGSIVQLNLGAANRDPAQLPDPERFDISRHIGRNLAFGAGRHTCLGVHLAKATALIAMETLFRRCPGLRLDEHREIVWYRNAANRGPEVLPMRFEPSAVRGRSGGVREERTGTLRPPVGGL
jgi:cytochrome P450